MRQFELPLRDASANAVMEVDSKATDDGKDASDDKNTIDYSSLAVVSPRRSFLSYHLVSNI